MLFDSLFPFICFLCPDIDRRLRRRRDLLDGVLTVQYLLCLRSTKRRLLLSLLFASFLRARLVAIIAGVAVIGVARFALDLRHFTVVRIGMRPWFERQRKSSKLGILYPVHYELRVLRGIEQHETLRSASVVLWKHDLDVVDEAFFGDYFRWEVEFGVDPLHEIGPSHDAVYIVEFDAISSLLALNVEMILVFGQRHLLCVDDTTPTFDSSFTRRLDKVLRDLLGLRSEKA